MLRMAWRNLWRHRTRSAISIAAIALSYALFLVGIGVAEDSYEGMEKGAEKAAGGSVLIHADGYWNRQTNDLFMSDGASVLETVRETDGVSEAFPRVRINGLLSTSASSTAVQLQGIDPEAESHLHDYAGSVTSGDFLQTREHEHPIVLGAGIAADLEVEPGDRVIMTATGPDGEMQRALFHLGGVLTTGSDTVDDAMAFTTVDAARHAFDLGDGLTQIGVVSNLPTSELDATLTAALSDRYEVLSWKEAIPDLVGMIELDRSWSNMYGIIVFIVVLFAIMNTFLMAVMERVREFGLLGALGVTPPKLALLLMLETIWLTIIAMALGFGLGYAGHLLIATYGIDMSAFYSEPMEVSGVAMSVDPIMRSTVAPKRWLNATISVFILTLVAAAYPAFKASRMEPAEAMRFYE